MQDISNTQPTNFSLPTSTQQKPVVVPVPVEVPVAVPVPVAVSHSGVYHEPAPTVSAPSLDSFSPQLDVNEITNSGTPASAQQPKPAEPTTQVREIKDQVTSYLPGHSTGGPTLTEQAQPYAQQAVGQATTLATQAKEQAVPLAQSAAQQAQSLAGQAAGYVSSAFNSVYGAAQTQAQNLQPNPTDTLDELTNRLDKGGNAGEHHSTAVTDKHTTAVTAVEPSPVLPIDGAALLPNQGKTDKDIDGVDAKFAGGSSTPQQSSGTSTTQNQSEGVIGGKHTHDSEQGATSTKPHEAHPAAPLPDEASSTLKNDDHAKNATQRREKQGAIYNENIHSDQPPAEPIAPVEHYSAVYPAGGNKDSSAPTGTSTRSSGPPLGLGNPIESVGTAPIQPGDSSSSSHISKDPKPAEPTPAQFTQDTSKASSGNTDSNYSASSAAQQAKPENYDDARQKADVAADKGANAASSALDSAAEKTGVNKSHVPSADQIKSTLDDKVTEKITGNKRGEREKIDTSPPTDHDNATPQFLEGEPKSGSIGTKIKHLFHKDDKSNSDF